MRRALMCIGICLNLLLGAPAAAQVPVTQCSDGIDNDGDGLIDYPADPGCASTLANDEFNQVPICSDGLDNDGDGFIDLADPGCDAGPNDNNELDLAACADGEDNDGDGATDYPEDPGCGSHEDRTEGTRTCSDGCACTSTPDEEARDTYPDNDPGEFVYERCSDHGNRSQCPLGRQVCTMETYRVAANNPQGYTTRSDYACPAGPEYACLQDPADGQHYCSPHHCFPEDSATSRTRETDEDFPDDEASRDEDGQCLGEIRFFSGAGRRCRRSGTQTAFQNCCRNENPTLQDTMGARGESDQISYREEHSTFEFYENQCDQQDQETALLADSQYCIALGTYCAEEWEFVGCVQRNQAYCCFSSKFAALVQRQGRSQLPSMGGFGAPSHPQCRGFTPEEFESLDFTKIDFSEYHADIRTRAQPAMQSQARQDARAQANR